MRLKVIFLLFLIISLFLPLITVLAQAEQSATGLWEYNKDIPLKILEYYNLLVPVAGILATIMIMIGGAIWLSSGGNPERIGQAKGYISGAIIGLILALFSYSLLFYVNPNLVSLRPIPIYQVEWMGGICCNKETGVEDAISEKDCKNGGGEVCPGSYTCEKPRRNLEPPSARLRGGMAGEATTQVDSEYYYYHCVPQTLNSTIGGICVPITSFYSVNVEGVTPIDSFNWVEEVKRLGVNIDEENIKCCSNGMEEDGFCRGAPRGLQNNVLNQLIHASGDIKEIINEKRLGISATITSISDDHIAAGNCDINKGPFGVGAAQAGCQHSQWSCHYGGRGAETTGFSHAIDLWTNESYLTLIYQIGKLHPDAKCNPEGDHLHVSLGCKGSDVGMPTCQRVFKDLINELAMQSYGKR